MKNSIVLSIVIIFFANTSFSQLTVYGYTSNGKIVPDINFYGEKKISKKVSLTAFMLVEQSWSEALVGFSYSPDSTFSIGASTGIEHGHSEARFGGMIWYGKGKWSLLLLGEKGHGVDNYWYKNTLSYQASKTISLGARAWRYIGVGPVGTFEIKKLGTSIWLMPAYDFEVREKRIAVGVSINL